MSPELRRYLVAEHAIGAFVVNFLINALIAWLMLGHLDVVPMWGDPGVVADTIGTIFILTLVTCLIATRIVRWHLRTGKAPVSEPPPASYGLLRKLPPGLGVRSLALAVVVTLVVAPLVTGALAASGLDGMALEPFLVFKATFAAGLSVFVQPIVALRALMEKEAALALPAP